MYAPASDHGSTFVGAAEKTLVFHDVNAAFGIPDLVFAVFDEEVLEARRRLEVVPITDLVDVAAMIYLARCWRRGMSASSQDLSRRTGVSRSYLSSTVLPRLCAGGHARCQGRGGWVATHPFDATVTRLATVEVKIRSWKQAMSQAIRHGLGTDRSWVLLPSDSAAPALRQVASFERSKIGLATIGPDGYLQIGYEPPSRADSALHRRVLSERLTKFYMAGRASGDHRTLFGQGHYYFKVIRAREQDAWVPRGRPALIPR